MKRALSFLSLAMFLAACAGEDEPPVPREEASAAPVVDREQVQRDILRFLGEDPDARLGLDEFSVGGVPLPDHPLVIRADTRAQARFRVFEALNQRRSPIAEQLAAEYAKLASEQAVQPAALTIPAELRSPDYTFGLETRNGVLWLHAHTEPRLYTVCSRAGEILAKGIELAELERRFPEFAGFERLGESDLIDY
jgi:hypothetical protein